MGSVIMVSTTPPHMWSKTTADISPLQRIAPHETSIIASFKPRGTKMIPTTNSGTHTTPTNSVAIVF
tara:strand:- start:954 stop:1154 length:201 start_codon:yes stop_codon:yes gene_type:complete